PPVSLSHAASPARIYSASLHDALPISRRWIARIMVTWGVLSMGTAFIHGWVGFLVLRFLLGIAEAGLFPGVILYLTFWFTAAYRDRKSTRLNSSHGSISYAVFCLKKKI